MTNDNPSDSGSRRFLRLAQFALIIALLAALATALSGPGYRLGWWDLGTAFSVLFRIAVFAGLGAVLLGLVSLIAGIRAGRMVGLLGLLALLLGAAAAAVPLGMRHIASELPMIHDITTDPSDPPEFRAVLEEREGASNPPGYPGDEVAAQQRDAYPDVRTLRLTEPVDEVFAAALAEAEALGWRLVEANPEDGRIEAVDETRWFGFKDDIVIRIRDSGSVTLLDMRSKSRVGRSDLGKNAERIRAFKSALLRNLTSAAS